MPISSTQRKVGPTPGNGTSRDFPFTFKVFDVSEVDVIRTSANGGDVSLSQPTDYIVTLNPDQNAQPGGTVRLSTALGVGLSLTILSAVPITQLSNWQSQGGFNPDDLDDDLDRQTAVSQQLAEQLGRTLVVPATVSDEPIQMAKPVGDALLAWSADGTRVVNIDPKALASHAAYSSSEFDVFTGDGVETVFNLSLDAGSLANLRVSIAGVAQTPGEDFFWNGGTEVEFAEPPADGLKIVIQYFAVMASSAELNDAAARAEAAAVEAEQAAAEAGSKLSQGENLADLESIKTARANIGLGGYVRPEDFNPTAGMGGDDTAAIQAAINAAKGSGPAGRAAACVVLSGKDYRVTGLVIDRPLELVGLGSKSSRIILVETATAAAIKISCAHDGNNYWTSGGAPAEVKLTGIGIVGPNRDAVAGQNVAHGVELKNATTNIIYTRVILEDLVINGVPGDGISATGWQGLLEWRSSYIAYVGRYSVNANSVADWRFINGDIFGAKKANLLFSGSIAMQLAGLNCYVAQEENMHIFGASSVVAHGCYFDLANQHNVRANMDPGGDLRMTDCTLRWASQAGDNIYSDLYIDPSPRGGRIQLNNVKFENAKFNGFGPNGPKYNIEFALPTLAAVRLPGVIFTADDDTDPTRGPLARVRISNDMRRIRMFRGEIPAASTAQLRSVTDLVNTVNKRPGAQVFEIDNNRYLSAISGAASAGWYSVGTLAINVDLP